MLWFALGRGHGWQPEHDLRSFWNQLLSPPWSKRTILCSLGAQLWGKSPSSASRGVCVVLWFFGSCFMSDSPDEATASRAPRNGQPSFWFSSQCLGDRFHIPTNVVSGIFMDHSLWCVGSLPRHSWTETSGWVSAEYWVFASQNSLLLPQCLWFLGQAQGFHRNCYQSWWNVNRTVNSSCFVLFNSYHSTQFSHGHRKEIILKFCVQYHSIRLFPLLHGQFLSLSFSLLPYSRGALHTQSRKYKFGKLGSSFVAASVDREFPLPCDTEQTWMVLSWLWSKQGESCFSCPNWPNLTHWNRNS